MSIFVDDYERVREVNGLGNHTYYPAGYKDYLGLDHECQRLYGTNRLRVIDSPEIRNAMLTIRNQSISRAEFQTLAGKLHTPLVKEAITNGMHPDSGKIGISIRAGAAFMPIIMRMVPGMEFGFTTQTRDEHNPTKTINVFDKLGSYENRTAFLFDPMLATGGSASEVIDAVIERGASRVIVVSSFASPEGVVKISQHSAVEQVISLPLEAGLNSNGYIVGGIGATAMLGDFGDRHFG